MEPANARAFVGTCAGQTTVQAAKIHGIRQRARRAATCRRATGPYALKASRPQRSPAATLGVAALSSWGSGRRRGSRGPTTIWTFCASSCEMPATALAAHPADTRASCAGKCADRRLRSPRTCSADGNCRHSSGRFAVSSISIVIHANRLTENCPASSDDGCAQLPCLSARHRYSGSLVMMMMMMTTSHAGPLW